MSSPLLDVWAAAAAAPYQPALAKNAQLTAGCVLLLLSLVLGAVFGLSMRLHPPPAPTHTTLTVRQTDPSPTFGAVYMICAVGVYV
ncbi:hypothetical protein ACEQ8H_002372 [Pleosporales sp. CAS-2024a]